MRDTKKWHAEAKALVNKACGDESMLQQREKIIEVNRFVRIPGAQWEGHTFAGTDLRERMDKYPRFEINKVLKEVRRIVSEMTRNRINVDFKPGAADVDQAISDKLNRRYRADYVESNGDYAVTNAFDDAVTGGFGAFRLCAEYEDEYDPSNEDMFIRFKPVFDAASCLFFDPMSKEMDKQDAEWCAECFSIPADSFKEEYGREGVSLNTIPDGRYEDNFQPNVIYAARFYQVKIEKDEVVTFENPIMQDTVVYFQSDIDGSEEIQEALSVDWYERARRKIKRRRVYCGVMDGEGWLDKPELMPFEYIPIIPVYGQRWFVDGVERIMGHATVALDSQRLENLMVSMLADAATMGTEGTPIVDVEQIQGLEKFWADRNTKRPAYLPLKSIRDKSGNVLAAANVAGYTQTVQLNQGMVGLLQYTGAAIQELTGGMGDGSMQSNIAQGTVEAMINRADSNSGVYMDNLAFAMKHAGRVWLSGARNLYGNNRYMSMLGEDGQEAFEELGDLTGKKLTVTVDVGADFSTRRDATVSKLTPILQALPPDHPNYNIVLGMIIENMDGEGLDDLRKYVHKELIMSGVVQPKNEQEFAELQQAQQQAQQNQPVDGNVLLAQAEMAKAQVSAEKNQMEYQMKLLDYEIERAKLELEAMQVGADVQLKRVDAQVKVINAIKPSGGRNGMQ